VFEVGHHSEVVLNSTPACQICHFSFQNKVEH